MIRIFRQSEKIKKRVCFDGKLYLVDTEKSGFVILNLVTSDVDEFNIYAIVSAINLLSGFLMKKKKYKER